MDASLAVPMPYRADGDGYELAVAFALVSPVITGHLLSMSSGPCLRAKSEEPS